MWWGSCNVWYGMAYRNSQRVIAQNSVLNLTDVYNIFKSDMETIAGTQ